MAPQEGHKLSAIRERLGKPSSGEVRAVLRGGAVDSLQERLIDQCAKMRSFLLGEMRRTKQAHVDIPRVALCALPTGMVARWAEDAGSTALQHKDTPGARLYFDFSFGMLFAITPINAAGVEGNTNSLNEGSSDLSLIDGAIERLQENPFKSVQAKEYAVAGAKFAKDVYGLMYEISGELYPQQPIS